MFTMMSSRLARPAIAAARGTASKTALRGYAAPAAADVKPPVALFGVDGTYASALVCKPEARSCRNQSARLTKTWASAGRGQTAVLGFLK
jgi:F-type H+-transporting ATPase subunit O